MDDRHEFGVYLEILARVVTARGGDGKRVAEQYVWPAGVQEDAPKAAVSLAPLLTSNGSEPSAPGATSSGVVPMPPGLSPPKS